MCNVYLARKEKLAGIYLMIISACTAQLCFVVIVVQAAKLSQLVLKLIGPEYLWNLLDQVLNPEEHSDCT